MPHKKIGGVFWLIAPRLSSQELKRTGGARDLDSTQLVRVYQFFGEEHQQGLMDSINVNASPTTRQQVLVSLNTNVESASDGLLASGLAQEPGSDAIAELSVEQATEIATGIADSSPDQIAQQLSTITSAPKSIMRDVLIQTTVLKIPQNRFEESPMLREAVADAYVLTQPEQRATNKNMLVDVLGTASGREFVFSGPPSLRKIAIEGILAGSASYLSAAAGDGWLDQKVLETYATPAFDVAAQKGSTTVSGDSVNNAVGSAMGHPPGVDVPADPEAFEALMQSAANGEANLYAGNEVVDTIAGGIAEATKDMGGDLAQPVSITSLPVQFSNEGTGPVSLQVFRVELEGESRLVDNQGRVYENFDDWKSSNVLPAGMVTYRDGMRSDGALVTERLPTQ